MYTAEMLQEYHGLLEELVPFVEVHDDKDCFCHLSPPCSNCVDLGYQRHLVWRTKSMLNRIKAMQALLPKE